MDEKKKYILMSLTFVVMLGIGFVIGKVLNPKQDSEEFAYQETHVSVPNSETESKGANDNEEQTSDGSSTNVEKTLVEKEISTKEDKPVSKQDPAAAKKEQSAPTPVETPKGISREEFQSHLLSGSRALDPGKGYVSKGLKVVVVGMRKGENRPSDIEAIRSKIRFGKWKSVSVVGLTYDRNGLVTQVNISPVYPAEASEEESF